MGNMKKRIGQAMQLAGTIAILGGFGGIFLMKLSGLMIVGMIGAMLAGMMAIYKGEQWSNSQNGRQPPTLTP